MTVNRVASLQDPVQDATLLRTADGGRTWAAVDLPAEVTPWFVAQPPVFPGQGMRGYLSTYGNGGVSTDGGATWSEAYPTWVDSFVAVAPDRWVGLQKNGIVTSADWGRNWTRAVAQPPKASLIPAALQIAGGTLFLASYGVLGDGPSLFRSTDGGVSWSRARWPGA